MDQTRPGSAPGPYTAPTSSPPPAPQKPKSNTRTFVLLGILGLAIACYAHDYFIAGPKSEAADAAIHKLVDARNALGVRAEGGKLVESGDIQKELGRAPSSTQEINGATVEVYRYWGGMMPHRQYISVMYIGSPRRYHVHHRNHMPFEDDYPVETKPTPNALDMKKGTSDDAKAPATDAPSSSNSGGGSGEKDVQEEAPMPTPTPGPDVDPYADPAAPAEVAPAADAPAAEKAEK